MKHLFRVLIILCGLALSANAQIARSGWTSTTNPATARAALGITASGLTNFNEVAASVRDWQSLTNQTVFCVYAASISSAIWTNDGAGGFGAVTFNATNSNTWPWPKWVALSTMKSNAQARFINDSFYGRSIPGETITGALGQFRTDVGWLRTNVGTGTNLIIAIYAGDNDFNSGVTTAQMFTNYTNFTHEIRTNGWKSVLFTIQDVHGKSNNVAWTAWRNEVNATIRTNGCGANWILDVDRLLPGIPPELTADGGIVHLNPAGQRLIAEEFERVIGQPENRLPPWHGPDVFGLNHVVEPGGALQFRKRVGNYDQTADASTVDNVITTNGGFTLSGIQMWNESGHVLGLDGTNSVGWHAWIASDWPVTNNTSYSNVGPALTLTAGKYIFSAGGGFASSGGGGKVKFATSATVGWHGLMMADDGTRQLPWPNTGTVDFGAFTMGENKAFQMVGGYLVCTGQTVISFQFAQNVATNNPTTLKAGSWMSARRVGY